MSTVKKKCHHCESHHIQNKQIKQNQVQQNELKKDLESIKSKILTKLNNPENIKKAASIIESWLNKLKKEK